MKLLLSLALLVIAGLSTFSQTPPDAAELTRMLNEFLDGAGRNDAAVHDKFWAEDLIYTRGSGVRTNKAEIMRGVRAAAPAPKIGDRTVYTAEDVKIQQYGNAAVVAFKLVGTTMKTDGSVSTSYHLNTGTFIKRSGKWQVVAWQATAVPAPAPPKTDSAAAATTSATKPASLVSISPSNRTYQKGPRGGCFYTNSSGKKVYVDKDLCN